MERSIFQESLFPIEKGDFSKDDFEKSIQNTEFVDCVRSGICNGFAETQSAFMAGDKSFRLSSDFLHEAAFNGIKSLMESSSVGTDVTFSPNMSGTERLHFSHRGYMFILKQTGAGYNRTKRTKDINEQNLDKHVITVAYSLDALRESIQGISLQYRKHDQVLYCYQIPMEKMEASCCLESTKVEARKPQLKIRANGTENG